MTKSKNTKKALLTSIMSIILCFVMLIGSTFAWFTDTVTSGKNKIVAGNIDVELYSLVGSEYKPVEENTNLFMEDALWEPGHVEVINLKVANVGTLALKYSLGINIAKEVEGVNVAGDKFKLSDYIEFAVIDGEKTYSKDDAGREAALTAAEGKSVKLSEMAVNESGVLVPKSEETAENVSEQYVTLIVYMPTSVENEANYRGNEVPTIELGVKLNAAQIPFESDSFGIDYDKDAEKALDPDFQAAANGYSYRDADGKYYEIDRVTNMISLFNNKSVTIIKDLEQINYIVNTSDNLANTNTTVDLNGHTYTGNINVMYKEPNTHVNSVLTVKNGTWKGSASKNTFGSDSGKELQNVNFENMTFVNSSTTNTIYGVYLKAGLPDSNFGVKDSTFNSNAKFEITSAGSHNLTFVNSTVNGRLWINGLSGNVTNTTINGELKFGEHKIAVDSNVTISGSQINGNLNIVGSGATSVSRVVVNNSTINGNIDTNAKTWTYYDLTLVDTIVTGSLLKEHSQYEGKLHIVSGTFGFDPTDYLVEGSRIVSIENGTWVVEAE